MIAPRHLDLHRQVRSLSLENYLAEVFETAAATKTRPVGRKSLPQLFAESPLKGLDLKFDRDPDARWPISRDATLDE